MAREEHRVAGPSVPGNKVGADALLLNAMRPNSGSGFYALKKTKPREHSSRGQGVRFRGAHGTGFRLTPPEWIVFERVGFSPLSTGMPTIKPHPLVFPLRSLRSLATRMPPLGWLGSAAGSQLPVGPRGSGASLCRALPGGIRPRWGASLRNFQFCVSRAPNASSHQGQHRPQPRG
jgi:hypothetical protein